MTSKVLRENWPPKHNNLTFCINSGSIPDQGQNCKSTGKIKDLAIPINQKSSKRSQNHEFYGICFLPKKSRKQFRINSGSRSKLQKYRENQRPCNPNISEIVQRVPKSWILRNFLFTKKSRKRFRINSGSRSKLQKYRENQRPCNPTLLLSHWGCLMPIFMDQCYIDFFFWEQYFWGFLIRIFLDQW